MSVAEARQSICRQCPDRCAEYRAGLIAHSDSAESCPAGRWRATGSPRDWWVIPTQQDVPTAECRSSVSADPFHQFWGDLHRRGMAAAIDQQPESIWLNEFAKRLPCEQSRRHFRAHVAVSPPPLAIGPEAYFLWSVSFHNEVNARRGRPPWPPDSARRRWS